MDGGGGAGVDIEVDAQSAEGVLDEGMVLIHDILRGAAVLAGLDGDGHAVLVGTADEEDILPAETEVTDIDVGRDIDAGQMADVHRAVCVRKRAGYEGSFKILFHNPQK